MALFDLFILYALLYFHLKFKIIKFITEIADMVVYNRFEINLRPIDVLVNNFLDFNDLILSEFVGFLDLLGPRILDLSQLHLSFEQGPVKAM